MGKYLGQEVRRVEDPRFMMGRGRYVANLNIHGMTFAAILRSPHAHAKILGIDVAEARHLQGVVAVFYRARLSGCWCWHSPVWFCSSGH